MESNFKFSLITLLFGVIIIAVIALIVIKTQSAKPQNAIIPQPELRLDPQIINLETRP